MYGGEKIINFIIYIAVSLDGFVADKNGSVDWLSKYNSIDCGYDTFIKEIDCLVIGNTTYKQVLGFGDWVYKGKKSYVLSSTKNDDENIEGFYSNTSEFLDEIKLRSYKNIWVMGGAKVCQEFINMKLINRVDLFIIPEVLNSGIKLFENISVNIDMKLDKVESFSSKISMMTYSMNYD